MKCGHHSMHIFELVLIPSIMVPFCLFFLHHSAAEPERNIEKKYVAHQLVPQPIKPI